MIILKLNFDSKLSLCPFNIIIEWGKKDNLLSKCYIIIFYKWGKRIWSIQDIQIIWYQSLISLWSLNHRETDKYHYSLTRTCIHSGPPDNLLSKCYIIMFSKWGKKDMIYTGHKDNLLSKFNFNIIIEWGKKSFLIIVRKTDEYHYSLTHTWIQSISFFPHLENIMK